MPTPYIKKLSKEGKGSVSTLEKKWEDAKKQAEKQGKGSNYGYITQIFKSMSHASLQAKARLMGTTDGAIECSCSVCAEMYGQEQAARVDWNKPEHK